MEMLLVAIAGDVTSRCISLLIDKYTRPTTSVENNLQRLTRMLLRIHVIVEEAEGRHIGNQGMLQQLKMLRDAMHRGYYMLDTFKYRAHERRNTTDHEVSHSFALSRFNPAKRICFSNGGRQSIQELEEVIGSLNNMIADVNELVLLLNNCPRICRQPYSTYLFMDKCMFNRQTEKHRVINFLLQTNPDGTNKLSVMPIIGPRRVGKSTLVAHVCDDERVRNHFSQIVFFSEDDLQDDKLTTLWDGGVIKHQKSTIFDANGRLLIVVKLVGAAVDESVRRRLHALLRNCIATDSKIIIISKSDKLASFGTTETLRLQLLSEEEYWYFFKMLTFGSTDPNEQPKLASIAMQIAKLLNRCFLGANIIAGLLRENVDTQFWGNHLRRARKDVQTNLSIFREWRTERTQADKTTYIATMSKKIYLIYDYYETNTDHEGNSGSTFQEILSGKAEPEGTFVALAWKSRIPPYKNYMIKMTQSTHMAIKMM